VAALILSLPSWAQDRQWNVLGIFDGENAELEKICEYNINQLEQIDSAYAKIVAVLDRTYFPSRDSSILVYDIEKDSDRSQIISNSISIGERDLGSSNVLEEVLSKHLGGMNILIIKGHGYGIISPGVLKIGYNSPQDPLIISKVLKKQIEKPIEVMIFDSCNMASIEVAYEFKGIVCVMVASQDLMYYSVTSLGDETYSYRPGIDYIDLILKLKPNLSPITIGKDVVHSFIDIVSKKDALFNRATLSALDLDALDISALKDISDYLLKGINNDRTRSRYMAAIKDTLQGASRFQPLGRNGVLTHYDLEDLLRILEDKLDNKFVRPNSIVIQSYSNSYVAHASGISILFLKDLSGISSVRKKELFKKYSRSRFARETGWDELMMKYHEYAPTSSR
jgi:hypothetical protein